MSKEQEVKHTPTPWGKGTTKKDDLIILKPIGKGYQLIATAYTVEDLDFIHTACNSHYALKTENTLLKEVNEAQIFTIEKYQKENEELRAMLEKLREKMQFEDFFTDEYLDIDNLLTKYHK